MKNKISCFLVFFLMAGVVSAEKVKGFSSLPVNYLEALFPGEDSITYRLPVDIKGDGYSTFGVRLLGSSDPNKIAYWELEEVEKGFFLVIRSKSRLYEPVRVLFSFSYRDDLQEVVFFLNPPFVFKEVVKSDELKPLENEVRGWGTVVEPVDLRKSTNINDDNSTVISMSDGDALGETFSEDYLENRVKPLDKVENEVVDSFSPKKVANSGNNIINKVSSSIRNFFFPPSLNSESESVSLSNKENVGKKAEIIESVDVEEPVKIYPADKSYLLNNEMIVEGSDDKRLIVDDFIKKSEIIGKPCGDNTIRVGTLLASVERILDACGYVIAKWPSNVSGEYVDYRIKSDIKLDEGFDLLPLFEFLRRNFFIDGALNEITGLVSFEKYYGVLNNE